MIDGMRNIVRIPELRNRIIFTFALLGVYRVGCVIPVPGVNPEVLLEFVQNAQGSVLGFLNTFTGGGLANAAIFTLGIMPYITASIILQLLTVVVPYLEKLSKEGELGRRKITQYTRYLTMLIALIQSAAIALSIQGVAGPGGEQLVPNPGAGFVFTTVLTLTTGCAFVMWLGEQISERGIGNGISLIIFAGIVVAGPGAVWSTINRATTGVVNPAIIVVLLPLMLAVTAFIVFMERSQRRIPVQYAKRVVGRKVYGGQSTYLPLRVNTGGVIPVIFASSVIIVPSTVAGFFGNNETVQNIANAMSWGQPIYYLLNFSAIIFFTFFYVSIIFNPQDTAENMRKYGGFIPGIRSGRRTAEYIDRILTRLTTIGALYLAVVSVFPDLLLFGIKLEGIPGIGPWLDSVLPGFLTNGVGIDFYFGGTSLLIVVGVAMDFVQQVESQLVMRNYDGFMKKGRIRGRR
ncbi:MAG: preprotein translocase subunit SecY [Acidobacteriota bacterium]